MIKSSVVLKMISLAIDRDGIDITPCTSDGIDDHMIMWMESVTEEDCRYILWYNVPCRNGRTTHVIIAKKSDIDGIDDTLPNGRS